MFTNQNNSSSVYLDQSFHMNPLVRDLLKRVIVLKWEHYDSAYLLKAARRELAKNAHLTQESDIKRAVAYGRWMIREEQGRVRFKTYRLMQQRYNPRFQPNNQQTTTQATQTHTNTFNEQLEILKLERGEE